MTETSILSFEIDGKFCGSLILCTYCPFEDYYRHHDFSIIQTSNFPPENVNSMSSLFEKDIKKISNYVLLLNY